MPTDDVEQAARDLANASRRLRDAAWAGARNGAAPVAASIRDAAGFSSRIPDAVRVYHYTSGAVVYVDPDVAPEAAALNNAGMSGTFTHPVFGQDVTVEQDAQPFFEPGAYAAWSDADDAMDAALTRWERTAGFT